MIAYLLNHTQSELISPKKITASQKGFSLIELLVAVFLLAMISVMIYSVLNVGIKFTDKGETKLLAMAREQGFLNLLHKQVNSAYYNEKLKKIEISAEVENTFRIITRSPFFYTEAGIVLAFYLFDPAEQTIFYVEKKDYYNIEYDEEYIPERDEMFPLLQTGEEFILDYDSDSGEVFLTYEGVEYTFVPRCQEITNR